MEQLNIALFISFIYSVLVVCYAAYGLFLARKQAKVLTEIQISNTLLKEISEKLEVKQKEN